MSVFEDEGKKTWHIKAATAANDMKQIWRFNGVDGFLTLKRGIGLFFLEIKEHLILILKSLT